MRAVFTLGGLLIVVGLIVFLFSKTTTTTLHEGKKAQDEVRQMSGRGDDGVPADRTIKLDTEPGASTVKSLIVTDVTPGGAMEKLYGVKKGDKITAIGQNEVANWNDFELAKAMLLQEGFEKSAPITVVRDGQTMQLPEGKTAAPGATTGQPGQAPSTPQAPSIQDQLRQIKIPGQQ